MARLALEFLRSTILPLAVASLLSLHGLRKRSLSPSGAATGFVVGYTILACPLRAFALALLVFYLLGSRVTKYGKQRKAELEDGYHEAGYRTGWQVLSNSVPALVATVLWSALFVPGSVPSSFLATLRTRMPMPMPMPVPMSMLALTPGEPYAPQVWCPASREVSGGWSRALLLAALGHFSCCLGDTFASELGILSRSPPVLITTLRAVPPGTNGAVSVGGTLASVVGGAVVGIAVAVSLLLESEACRGLLWEVVLPLVVWGALAGGLGSLIDSLLGATLQRTRYSVESKRVLPDDAVPKANAEVKVISGINVLTNNQVNIVSSTMIATLLGVFA